MDKFDASEASTRLVGASTLNIDTKETINQKKKGKLRSISRKFMEKLGNNRPEREEDNDSPPDLDDDGYDHEDDGFHCSLEKCSSDEHDIYLRPEIFCEFLVLHLLFYFLLGPLIILLAPLVGTHLLRNQSFLGLKSSVMRQYIEFFATALFITVFYATKTAGLEATEVYMMVVAVFIRIICISSKYAYQSECSLRILRTRTLTDQQINDHLPFIPEWRKQREALIKDEFCSAMMRLQIEKPLFSFVFLENPSLNKQRSFAEGVRSLQQIQEAESEGFGSAEPNFEASKPRVDGFRLAFEFLRKARKVRFQRLSMLCMLVSVLRALIPTFYRLYEIKYQDKDIPLLTEKPYAAIILFLINTVFFWMNLVIIAVVIEDLRTKIFCLKQVGYMITPKNLCPSTDGKLSPTMNIFDAVSLKAWLDLRKLVNDYGKKYILRNNFNVTASLLFYGFVIAVLLLRLLGIINIYNDPLLLVLFSYESVVFFVIFLLAIIGGACINDQYKVHKGLLKKVKSVISNFQKLSHLYVGENAIEPDNPVYKEGLKLLKQELGNEDLEAKLVARAQKLMSILDEVMDDLSYEETTAPFTVMGTAVNFNVVKSLLITVASLLFAISQRFLGKLWF